MADPIIKALDDWLVAAGGTTTNLAVSQAELWRQIDDQIVGSAPASASTYTHISRIYNSRTGGSIANGLPVAYMLEQIDINEGGTGAGGKRELLESIASNYTAASTLLTGLTFSLKLGEASGTRFDETANNHDFTDNNTVTQGTGIVGNCGQFTAANSEYLSIADAAALSGSDRDMSGIVWVNADTLTGNHVIWGKYDDQDNEREWRVLYRLASTSFSLQVSGDGTSVTQAHDTAIVTPATGTWYMIYWYHDATGNEIGISVNNNTAITTAHTTGVFDSATQMTLGTYRDTTQIEFWNGRIDNVNFYGSRLLTGAEVTEHWNSGSAVEHPF